MTRFKSNIGKAVYKNTGDHSSPNNTESYRLNIDLAYGRHGLRVNFPKNRTTVVAPQYTPGLCNPSDALLAAIRSPINTMPLRKLALPGMNVAISVCDVTRAQPSRIMMEALLNELSGIVSMGNITVLIATGTHRPNTRAEQEKMLGPEILAAVEVMNHSANDQSSLIDIGLVGNSVPVRLNRRWMEADLRITTGFVEPHFFAGFSGGPKMVAPGLAGLDTILTLHDSVRIGHPAATWGVTYGNPVHDDIRAIAANTGVNFSIDVTLNSDQEITSVFAGELVSEHRAACEYTKHQVMQAVDELYDVVVTSNSGYPLDQNLYQSVKGMSAAARVVQPGGVIVCATECSDGIPDHGNYANLLASRDSPAEILEMIESSPHTVPDQWQVQIQAKILQRARVLVKADGLTDSEIIAAHFEPIRDVSDGSSAGSDQAGPAARVCVLPQGPQTIPYLR